MYMRKLRKDFPTRLPVEIRQVTMPEHHNGCTWRLPDRFVIHIRKEDPDVVQGNTILHELAHALTWKEGNLHHDTAWAKKYAELVRWNQSESEWAYD